MDLSVDITTEDIQREALKILYDGLNNEIDSRSAAWVTADTAYFASIGRAAPGFSVEHVKSENFYPGTIPSLINAEIEKYPNCCSFAHLAVPRNSDDSVGEMYAVELEIAIMVKSITSELEVNSRIQKTLEAAHAVMSKNRSLNHSVPKFVSPRKTMGDVFVRKERNSQGPRWFWQGGTLIYSVDKWIKLIS